MITMSSQVPEKPSLRSAIRWFKMALNFSVFALAAYKIGTMLLFSNPYQEDLRLFLSAAAGAQKGVNPYNAQALFQTIPTRETQALNWFYPPHTLSLFSELNQIPTPTAFHFWYFSKLFAAIVLIAMGWLHYGRRTGWAFFLLVVTFSFRNPIQIDLESGNVTLWEQLFTGIGMILYFNCRSFTSGFFLFLGAQWKLTLSALLGGLTVLTSVPNRNKIRTGIAFAGSWLAALIFSHLLYPSLLTHFWKNLITAGKLEQADLSWDGTHFSSLYNLNYFFQNPTLGQATWLGLVALVCLAILRVAPRVRANPSTIPPPLTTAFLMASYALCVPRLKLYSLMIWIAPLLECKAQSSSAKRPLFFETLVWIATLSVTLGGTSMENHSFLYRLYNLRFLLAFALIWGMLYSRISRLAQPKESGFQTGSP